ncbi:MAG TPA: sigma-70 family RNA polymerase sigma factor [Verrucomicrobiae bacterium]|nr:sigma-70 family RNA polymerase sigma factor [Verrucomicrobiae bacterium]
MNLDLVALEPAEVDERSRASLRMEESAFRVFYGKTAGPLLGYLLRVSRDRALAEDLCQEAYCRFLSAQAPEMDERQARSYLFRIATNLMRDRWRRPREDTLEEDNFEAASRTPHADLGVEMRQAFERLGLRERQLLWLAYVEGSNHKEIAACTGLRAASIRVLLSRARRNLANLLGAGKRHEEVTK